MENLEQPNKNQMNDQLSSEKVNESRPMFTNVLGLDDRIRNCC